MFKVKMVLRDNRYCLKIKGFDIVSYQIDVTHGYVLLDKTVYEFDHDSDSYIQTEDEITISTHHGSCVMDNGTESGTVISLIIDDEKIIITGSLVFVDAHIKESTKEAPMKENNQDNSKLGWSE